MGGRPQRRKANLAKNKQNNKACKTKHYKRDIDQVINDILPQNLIKLVHQKPQEELPGLGQYYCVFCARYFVESNSLESHNKTKDHKRRVKETSIEPYTIKDSLKYGGLSQTK